MNPLFCSNTVLHSLFLSGSDAAAAASKLHIHLTLCIFYFRINKDDLDEVRFS